MTIRPLETSLTILLVVSIAIIAIYSTPKAVADETPINQPATVVTPYVADIASTTSRTTDDTVELPIYIVADLSSMQLYLMRGITPIKTYTIVSKGKPGSYYETPAGEYEIQLKKESHFSSFGEVYMPYSMQFFGNFFIHGIPYYPDGTKVSSTYSGGCIRLADDDARELYESIPLNTSIIVKTDSDPNMTDISDMGQVTAQHMLTNLISLEFLNQERFMTFENREVKTRDLLGPVTAGNDEAISLIKNALGYSRYEELINQKAKALGLSSSLFESTSDREVFYTYLKTNRSYLLQFLPNTN